MNSQNIMEKIIEISYNWKDFFWIIFTLVATFTSVLTYLQVRKSVYQTLYNKVTDEQMELYNNMLILLGNSIGDFLISLDLENYIKFNLIAHLVSKGILVDCEEYLSIYTIYMDYLNNDCRPNQELQTKLEDIPDLLIELHDDMNINLMDTSCSSPANLMFMPSAKKITVCDICNVLVRTPKFEKTYKFLEECINNIYMPKKLKKMSDKFHENLLKIFCSKTLNVISKKEKQIYCGKNGTQIEIIFSALYNEVINDQSDLKKDYQKIKMEIRQLLKIDSR